MGYVAAYCIEKYNTMRDAVEGYRFPGLNSTGSPFLPETIQSGWPVASPSCTVAVAAAAFAIRLSALCLSSFARIVTLGRQVNLSG